MDTVTRKKLLMASLVVLLCVIWGRFFFQLSRGVSDEAPELFTAPASETPPRTAPQRSVPTVSAFAYQVTFRDPFAPQGNLLIYEQEVVVQAPAQEAPPPPKAPTPPPLVLKGIFDETAMLATPSGTLVFAKAGQTIHAVTLLRITSTEVETRYEGHTFTLKLQS